MVKSVGPAGLERIELKRMTERVARLLTILQEAEAQIAAVPGAWAPPVDVCETATVVYVRIELPDVSASQIKIGLNNGKLCIHGEKKKRSARRRIISHLCSERSYGHFSRVVPLRWTISIKDATAELGNGILVVKLPKISERRGSEFLIPISETEVK
jgi:HSP20 family molecular chaperone IbpA